MVDREITRDTLIEDLEISVRLHHCLTTEWDYPRNAKRPATVGDFINAHDHELMRIPNFGRKSLVEWRKIVWQSRTPIAPSWKRRWRSIRRSKRYEQLLTRLQPHIGS